EDGIRDFHVTGVQTCALPIYISVHIESIDSLKTPYIQYNYIAKGSSYAAASARASKIAYKVNQNAENLMFDSHFALEDKQLIRRSEERRVGKEGRYRYVAAR